MDSESFRAQSVSSCFLVYEEDNASACMCVLAHKKCLCWFSSSCVLPCTCSVCVCSVWVSPVDQVTLGANCLSLGAQRWAALIVLWPGTRCSFSYISFFYCVGPFLFESLLVSHKWSWMSAWNWSYTQANNIHLASSRCQQSCWNALKLKSLN